MNTATFLLIIDCVCSIVQIKCYIQVHELSMVAYEICAHQVQVCPAIYKVLSTVFMFMNCCIQIIVQGASVPLNSCLRSIQLICILIILVISPYLHYRY